MSLALQRLARPTWQGPLAADAPAVVIEANFRPGSEHERAKLSGLAAQPVEVYCACPPELAIQRYNARITHPVHVVATLQMEAIAEYRRPVGIGALVTVAVDVNAVATAVRACHDRVHARPVHTLTELTRAAGTPIGS